MSDETPTSPLPDPNSTGAPLLGDEHDTRAQSSGENGSASPSQQSFWRRPAGIGLVAALALLLAGGVGAAIALAVKGNDVGGTLPAATESTPAPESVAPDDQGGGEDSSTTPVPSEQAPGEGSAGADAAALSEAITRAVDAAGGVGATEIEVARDGWEVEVQRADGTEAKVMVAVDGSAVIREEDDDDDDPLIEVAQLRELVRISLDASGGGRIEKISTDDDSGSRYDVEIRLSDGTEVEVELDAQLNVVEVDRD